MSQKGKSQNGCFKKKKHAKIPEKYFPLKISSVNVTKSKTQEKIAFTEQIFNGKRHFLCSDCYSLVRLFFLRKSNNLINKVNERFLWIS